MTIRYDDAERLPQIDPLCFRASPQLSEHKPSLAMLQIISNPPQVGILGVGRVVEKPVVYQGEITKRSMLFLSLAFDRRDIDGAPAAAFLHTLKGHLEDPWWMVADLP